jgi:tetratricopeptide (TPR) repeat protein
VSELAETLPIIAPCKPGAKELLVDVALQQGDGARAVELLRPMISASPLNPEYHGKVGVAHALAGDLGSARNHLLQAIQLKPDYLHALLDLCRVARSLGFYDESIQAGTAALAIEPDGPILHSNLALSYELYGLYEKAREHYECAAVLCPNDPDAQQKAGVACLYAGAKEQARQYFEKAIALSPRLAPAYRGLADINKYATTKHQNFARMQALLDAPEATDDDQCQLHFALGKMYDDCGEYESAFEHFAAGNRLENRKHNFDPSAYHRYVDRLITSFPANRFSRAAAGSHPGRQPLFIVGMPRSGTSLVEQIMACHPQVYGAGELPWVNMLQNALPSFLKSTRPYPECLADMTDEACQLLARKYLDYLGDLSDHGQYSCIIDKTPDNYEHIGLISLLFPNARFIHCQRNPLDNAVSMFSLMFPDRHGYCYDFFNLGARYAGKERLMAHWKSARPQHILDIEYETLVHDQEQQTRRLLEFLGLPWDDRCLKFFESEHSVHTASHSQVRKPMYTSSIGRWKHYAKHLEPLHRGLRWPESNSD